MTGSGTDVSGLLAEAAATFEELGFEQPRLEAELLLSFALDVERQHLYLEPVLTIAAPQVERFRHFVSQRVARRPLQYVTGEAAFRYLRLRVDESVLIPRPETEVLVDRALELLSSGAEETTVLDVGCGSGAIGLALAFESAAALVVGMDISPEALVITRFNARRHGLEARVRLLRSDLLDPVLPRRQFDLIVSNPPYVASGDLANLDPEVRDYEPRGALDGGADGLVFYRRIAIDAASCLASGGHVVVETGDGQAEAVERIIAGTDRYDEIRVSEDLNGIARIVSGRVRRID